MGTQRTHRRYTEKTATEADIGVMNLWVKKCQDC